MNAQKNIVRRIEKDMNSIKKRSQEDLKDIKDYKKKIENDIIDIKKDINLLRIEFMVIKSDLLKDKEFEKIKTSEATSQTEVPEEETKDNIAKGYWWS